MDREQLKGWLDRGLSLEQIGHLAGRHPSTVGHWVKKYGLTPNGQAKHGSRGGLTREQLEPLVQAGLTLAQIGARLDRSSGTVRYWLRKHGLSTTSRRGRRPIVARELVEQARDRGERTLTAWCPRHGTATFVIENSGRVRCRQCRIQRVSERRRAVKRQLVDEAGGSCVRCGYRRDVRALHFHHLDPTQKQFGVAARGATISIDALRAEAAKCVLLCANCHAEVGDEETDLPLE